MSLRHRALWSRQHSSTVREIWLALIFRTPQRVGAKLTLNARCCPWTEPTLSIRLWTTKRCSPGFGLLYSFASTLRTGWTLHPGLDGRGGQFKRTLNRSLAGQRPRSCPGRSGWNRMVGQRFLQRIHHDGRDSGRPQQRRTHSCRTRRASGGVRKLDVLKVLHSGGTQQDFSIVVSAVASPTPQADLAVFDGSILPSVRIPLKDDLISIRLRGSIKVPVLPVV